MTTKQTAKANAGVATSQQGAEAGLARVVGIMMIVVGAAGLLLALGHKAFRSPPLPEVVTYANLAGCALDVALGWGVMQRKRAAWAFALAMAVVFLVVNLFSLPGMLRAGMPVGGFSAALCLLRVVWGALLITSRKEF
jgi:hypothetical protein